MPQLIYDLMFSSTFVIILLAVLRFGKAVIGTDTYAYKNIIIGLSFLSVFSLIQLGGHQGVFAGIPMLREAAGRKLAEAIGITGGLIFLLSGVSSWLPRMMKSKHNNQSFNRRYFCLKMIGQSLDRGKTLNEVFGNILEYLSTYLGIPRCAIYTYSVRKKCLRLSGKTGFSGDEAGPLREISVDQSCMDMMRHQRPLTDFGKLFDILGSGRPDVLLPMGNSRRLYAALICWIDKPGTIDDDFIDFMASLGSMLSRHIQSFAVQTQKEFYLTQQTLKDRFNETCGHLSSLHDLMPEFYRILKDAVGAEFASLATLDSSGENMVRYTIGSTGRMLLEKGISRRTRGTDVYDVYRSRKSLFEPKVLTNDRTGEQDGLFLSCGMRSKMVCPVKAGKRVVAVLTVGHARPGYFTTVSLRRVEGLADLVSGVVQRDRMSRTMETKEDLMLRLQLMQRNLIDGAPVGTFFDQVCDVLTRRMKCTIARISLLDQDRLNLRSQACRTIRPIVDNLREKEALPLSLLPWHRLTLDNEKVMLINQEDPESQMPSQESSSVLIPDIKSAMLVPIRLDDTVQGVISIGESRNWNRRAFGATDLIFAKDVAAKCSLALQLKKMQVDYERSREQLNRISAGDGMPWGRVRSRIKSPLTSIIGAVELLKAKGRDDEFSTKYHDLILRSADRIKVLTDGDYIEDDDVEETVPEMVIG